MKPGEMRVLLRLGLVSVALSCGCPGGVGCGPDFAFLDGTMEPTSVRAGDADASFRFEVRTNQPVHDPCADEHPDLCADIQLFIRRPDDNYHYPYSCQAETVVWNLNTGHDDGVFWSDEGTNGDEVAHDLVTTLVVPTNPFLGCEPGTYVVWAEGTGEDCIADYDSTHCFDTIMLTDSFEVLPPEE